MASVRSKVWVAVPFGLLGLPSAAHGQPVQLEPSSPWQVDYSETGCALLRTFGSAGADVTLSFDGKAISPHVEITLVSEAYSTTNAVPRVRFLPDPDLRRVPSANFIERATRGFNEALTGRSSNAIKLSLQLTKTGEAEGSRASADGTVMREQEIEGLEIKAAFSEDFVLLTGELNRPLEALRACRNDLLAAWGLDLAAYRTAIQPAARDDFQSWAGRLSESYTSLFRRNASAEFVTMQVIIGEDGRARSCHVLEVSSAEAKGAEACQAVLNHARYIPARDANGEAVNAIDVLTAINTRS